MKAKYEIRRGTIKQMYVNMFTDDTYFYRYALAGSETINLYISKFKNNPTPDLTKVMSIYSAANGIVTCTFAVVDTDNMDAGDYVAEVHVVGTEIRSSPILFRILERVKD